jgi:hypothetical protein
MRPSVPSSRVMKLPASSSVTSWRPRGSGIGSSKRRFQPRSANGARALAHRLLVMYGPDHRSEVDFGFSGGAMRVK